MANLGFQTVYKLFNDQPSFLCERAFLTSGEDEFRFAPGTEIVSLENQKALFEFDILAFSVSFENDYPNILKIMEGGGIPLLAKERSERHPLVMGGGVALTLNPEPLADFFDIFVLGEAEDILPAFCRHFDEARRHGHSRETLLMALQTELPQVYVPRLYDVLYSGEGTVQEIMPRERSLPKRIKVSAVKDINAFCTEEVISAADVEMEDMFLIEVNRGCARGCRFCAAGCLYRPVRFRRCEVILNSVDRAAVKKKRIGLVGTAVSDHPALMAVCRHIIERQAQIGLGSLRVDRIGTDMVKAIKAGGIETVALSPEAGSQRMRDVIHKGVTEADILNAVEILAAHDILHLRLYFMVGLPTERDEDIDAILELVKKIKHHVFRQFQGKKKLRRMTLSVNQFIPKPFTPFQWCPLEDVRTVAKKIRKIQNAFRKDGGIRIVHDLPKWNYVQALLSLGDRRVGGILWVLNRLGGNWAKALKEVPINPDFYVYRPKRPNEFLPWEILDLGISKIWLLHEYEKAVKTI